MNTFYSDRIQQCLGGTQLCIRTHITYYIYINIYIRKYECLADTPPSIILARFALKCWYVATVRLLCRATLSRIKLALSPVRIPPVIIFSLYINQLYPLSARRTGRMTKLKHLGRNRCPPARQTTRNAALRFSNSPESIIGSRNAFECFFMKKSDVHDVLY